MRVKVDEPGNHVEATGVDRALRLMLLEVADLGNLPILDADIGPIARHPSAIDHHPVGNHKVEFRHRRLSSFKTIGSAGCHRRESPPGAGLCRDPERNSRASLARWPEQSTRRFSD